MFVVLQIFMLTFHYLLSSLPSPVSYKLNWNYQGFLGLICVFKFELPLETENLKIFIYKLRSLILGDFNIWVMIISWMIS